MAAAPIFEGEVDLHVPDAGKPCRTWYKVLGKLDKPTLIGLHGGPGAGQAYLSPLYDVYNDCGIPIVTYDQIGCGRSTHFPEKMGDASFWTVELFVKELENLIEHLGLREKGFYLFGQSWGGILGGVYAASAPSGLKKLILASAPSSMPLYAKGCKELVSQLPEDVRKIIEDCERRGDYESPEFEQASGVFYARHFCRMDPMPEDIQLCFQNVKEDPTAYMTM
ncbi:hypothetical protein PFICI_11294 [Pestalotiopsis fici W106-1]|uniref:AB hydrolase-1 domain-containing protein n=1 Tax=Pestalotiopsis fici (strain W106-1 / CGMCC3.15140) TaxID=1229662 RepID=W3WU93_PESFW|nr:uncharacterized protein PFICI_11294 [Pestalotiopsis fici W106-1]ETS77420.1 hypothetical protein PFICI_11294 [Pestalotiopsis fici W106-1]